MFRVAVPDYSLSVSMFQEFRRRISWLVATKYQLGQVTFFLGSRIDTVFKIVYLC